MALLVNKLFPILKNSYKLPTREMNTNNGEYV